MLAGDSFFVNFQNDEATTPTHYSRDTGLVFGDRGGGLFYGWTADHTDQSRERSLEADQRLDTLIHFEQGQSWEFALPNGTYEVTVAVGDPANNDGLHTINVEGVNLFNAVPDGETAIVGVVIVTVNDGRLSLDQGAAANKSTRIDYVHIVGVSTGGNIAPSTPTINEPSMVGQVVSPADVHMEAVGYSDSDGDAHKSTDWSIWTVDGTPEPVWQTLGIESIERYHTHLGDGIFINSRAGTTELAPDTDYELRVRFRDDAGSVGQYATRLFHTSAASTEFPMLIEDVDDAVAPVWASTFGDPVELAVGSTVEIVDGANGGPFLQFSGSRAVGNTVTNFAAIGVHSPVKVVITAGSAGLLLAESDLTFTSDDGEELTVFMPGVNLVSGGQLVLWVASSGATYVGLPGQTSPDFTSLARQADLSVPFIANKPGFVIEEVGAGYRLPVNIAFVPDPGPDPDDPLYFVTELYGSIQVVTRDGTKHEFATGLLDYNPTGPISGSGEQGLTGIAVVRNAENPEVYEVFVALLADNGSPSGGAVHYPKVEKLTSVAGGLSMQSRTVLLNMQPETQGQSHQISNLSIGPDGKLYVHNGDGFTASTAQNLDQFRGKVLRLNLDGSAPSDNPFYDASNGVTARDYVFAYGFRNPFGGAWRASDGQHYEVENGPSVDRFARVLEGVNYGWNGSDASMQINAIYNWSPATAPVNLTFVQPETFRGSLFPAEMQDHAFVSESGPTYAQGPQSNGKRVSEFVLGANAELLDGPDSFIQYVGAGRSSIVGLAAGPDGLYFTTLYEDSGSAGPTAAGAKVYRIRYVNPLAGDYDIDGDIDEDDATVWRETYGSNLFLGADGNGDGRIDAADYTVWRDAYEAFTTEAANAGAPLLQTATEPTVSESSPLVAQEVGMPRRVAFEAVLVNGDTTTALGGRTRFRPPVRATSEIDHDKMLLVNRTESAPAETPNDTAFASLRGSVSDTSDDAEEETTSLQSPDGGAGGQAHPLSGHFRGARR
ncbi:PQQ-dependent sugar dehydrogenase [Botrimarina colliarenosi]|uniref:PQQ-dependent sugar dehydrogenase n=1 Tax=Botrimarina colliarenosi TaxID=2528001 RepID=UPI0018D2DABA|nr:PQQ-dependent sugar dehydrogenase [Botrimarina colliarenosi]